MLKKLFIPILLLAIFCTQTIAQTTERLLLKPSGSGFIKLDETVSVKKSLNKANLKDVKGNLVKHTFNNIAGLIDTLTYPRMTGINFTDGFRFDGQDVGIVWFECPADLTIKAAGYASTAVTGAGAIELRQVKLNWTADQIKALDAPVYMGYYPHEGDLANNVEPFGEIAGGEWVDRSEGVVPAPPWAHEDYDLWSDEGTGAPTVPNGDGTWQWVEMNLLGEPEMLQGEVFGVVFINTGPIFVDATDNVVFNGSDATGFHGFKYYENGRIAPEDPGWWMRKWTWEVGAIVDLTGDRAPVINSFNQIATSVEQGPFTVTANVTDDNPSGGAFGVASVTFSYSTDGGTTWTDVAMAAAGDDYTAEIPAQTPGTEIQYKINAVDVEGLPALETVPVSFTVFAVNNPEALLVFNGLEGTAGYPQDFYFGSGDYPNSFSALGWTHDRWAFGPLTEELVNGYQNIIEICAGGPADINSAVIRAWLDADGSRNYMLAGDEWLGTMYGWDGWDAPFTIPEGDFARDILGVDVYYSDIVEGAAAPTDVMPIEGSALGGALYTAYTQLQTDSGYTSPMIYHPSSEITQSNWLDAVDFVEGVEADMTGIAPDSATVLNIAGHRELAAGNKIVFLGYDPLSITQPAAEYWWWGFTRTAPHSVALDWFGGLVSVKQIDDAVPANYKLSQNYPNPFNPSTTIEFSLPEKGLVSLKIYNVLGQEVAQVLNKDLAAGSYSVDFDASQLSSGMYIYSIQSGSVEVSKKMMLLK